MKKLTWTVTTHEPAPCPDYVPDPYTGELPRSHCLVNHMRVLVKEMSKEFETVEEAEKFVQEAPSSCSHFRLDGVEVKDSRPERVTIWGSNVEIDDSSLSTNKDEK